MKMTARREVNAANQVRLPRLVYTSPPLATASLCSYMYKSVGGFEIGVEIKIRSGLGIGVRNIVSGWWMQRRRKIAHDLTQFLET